MEKGVDAVVVDGQVEVEVLKSDRGLSLKT